MTEKNKELRLGVIGAGNRGRLLARVAHRPEQGSRIVAACSLNLKDLDVHRELFDADMLFTRDYREILAQSDIDAVLICTPDHLHEEHTIAALEAGKHVYLEKPMAITIESCDRIMRAAKETGGILYPGHNMRFFPVMRKMRELIAGGAIGEVQAVWCRHFISYGGDAYFRDWHAERKYTTGLLLQKAAHDIDVIHWLAGGYTRRVVGMGKLSVYDKLPRREPDEPCPSVEFNRANWPPKATGQYNPVIDVEDHSMILMQLDNGVQASYMQCHYTPDDHRNYTVIGTEGRIENYGDHSAPERWATVHLWNQRTGYSEQGHKVFRIPHKEGDHGGSDPLVVEDFLHLLRSGECEGATPWDARMAVAAGVLGTESLRNGSVPLEVFV